MIGAGGSPTMTLMLKLEDILKGMARVKVNYLLEDLCKLHSIMKTMVGEVSSDVCTIIMGPIHVMKSYSGKCVRRTKPFVKR